MYALTIILYMLLMVLLIVLIVLGIKGILFIDNANILLKDIQKKLNSYNNIFQFIDKFGLTLRTVQNSINGVTKKIFGGLFRERK